MAMTSAPTEPQCHRIFESGDENSENILYCIEAVTLKFLCMVFVTVFLSVCVYACGFFSECKCNMFNKYVDIEEELRYTSVATCLVFRSARSSSLFFVLLVFLLSRFDANLIAHMLILIYALNLSSPDPFSPVDFCLGLVGCLSLILSLLLQKSFKTISQPDNQYFATCLAVVFIFRLHFLRNLAIREIYGQKYANQNMNKIESETPTKWEKM